MAKSKKTKIHKKIDGQLLQMNKKFSNLKMKQKDKITGWVYEEYKKYVTEHEKAPDLVPCRAAFYATFGCTPCSMLLLRAGQ